MKIDLNFKIFQEREWPWEKYETEYVAFKGVEDAKNLRKFLNYLENRIIKLEKKVDELKEH